VRASARLAVLLVVLTGWGHRLAAQLDPVPRRLLQVGYNQPVEGNDPFSGYAFFYYNRPGFVRSNLTFRAAVAPVYLDSELGFRGLLSPGTDVGVGVAGGGFADSHNEIVNGKWRKEESFTGHAGEFNASVYHLFNPLPPGRTPQRLAEVPVQGLFRTSMRYSIFERNDTTADGFEMPDDFPAFAVRTGLRFGGREPLMTPPAAVELSVWYQGMFRLNADAYGFAGDREISAVTHLFWARALGAFTFTNLGHRAELSLTAGASVDPDRLSTYRLGGNLPLASEFPLMIPGYYFEELSARHFALLDFSYAVPLGGRFDFVFRASTAAVSFLPSLEQGGNWHSGVGGGVGWTSPGGAWQVLATYAYGVDAIRTGGRGANNVGILIQYDLDRANLPDADEMRTFFNRVNSSAWRGFGRMFRR
jgi:hypothetical protein